MKNQQAFYDSPWIVCPRPQPRARVRLLCFPFGGGAASMYHGWSKPPGGLPADIEVCAVQLPGREQRLGEPLFIRLEPLLAALVPALQPFLDDRPFALFGHSMGATLSFEVSRRLLQQHTLAPAHLFLSARPAPPLSSRLPSRPDLPEADFIEQLRAYEGIPEMVLQDAELRALFLPIIRADFSIIHAYHSTPGEPLDVPITAFGGTEDPSTHRSDLEEWQRHTTHPLRVQMFAGGHFYLRAAQADLLAAIAYDLRNVA